MRWRAADAFAAATVLAAASLACAVLLAQRPGEPRSAPRYRRVFVPEEELQSQVKGLLPVKRDEFQRRLSNRAVAAPGGLGGPRISRGRYAARLEGLDLVEGVARFEITRPSGGANSLSWEGSNLAFGQGVWEGEPPRKASLGIGPDDALSLRVDETGVVSFPWSRRGRVIEKGGIEFDLDLPSASLHELRLTLPSDLRLTADQGLVTRGDQAGDTGQVEWLVELGGIRQVTLRILPEAASSKGTNLTLLRETARYVLTPTDVTAEFQFQLELHGQSLRTAQLHIDPRLQVTGVFVRMLPVAWSVAAGDKHHLLSIEFPEPLTGGAHTVAVQTTSKLAAGQPWRLPRIAWQSAVWQEGSCTLSIPPNLQVAVTTTHACRTAIGVPQVAGGESLGFQYHAADAFAEVEVTPRQARLAAAIGVTAQFDSTTQITATLRADITSQEGQTFEVDAVFSKEWTVDSLVTEPPELLEDRPVVLQDDRTRTMRLKFTRPIAPRSPVRLVVHARRQQADISELSSDSLWRWCQLRGVQPRPTVLSVRNNLTNYDLQVSGDLDVERLDPQFVPQQELALLEAPPAGLLFRLHPQAGAFRLSLQEGKPRYTAAWEVTAACSRSRVRQEMIVRCVPSGPGVSRLILRSTPPPDREIRWRLTGISDATIAAQTRRDVGVSAEGGASEAVWELELSRPLGQPFALDAAWETPRQARHPIALFSCSEAATQTCLVRLTAEDDSRWLTAASGLTALPIAAEDRGGFTSTRGLFRYDTGQRPELAVIEAAGDAPLAPLARIDQAELSSRFGADGSALCALSLAITNTGLARLPVDLPAGAILQEVSVNGRATNPLRAATEPGNLRIPLPAGEQNLDVRVSYAAPPQQRPLYVQTWRAQLPKLTLPAPPVVWRVALPPGIRRVASPRDADWQAQLRARFWGPFVDYLPGTHWLHPWQPTPSRAGRKAEADFAEEDKQAAAGGAADSSWTILSQERPWSDSLAVSVCEQHRLALFCVAFALLWTGLVLIAPRRWLPAWWLLAAVVAALVMLLPLAWTPPLAGAFWGVLAGCAAALLRPVPMSLRRNAAPVSTARWLAGASASLLLLLAWLPCGAPAAFGAQPAAGDSAKNESRPPVHRVVVPVDEDQQPVGDYVFVEEPFYDWLFGQRQSGQFAGAWQITKAAYEVRWPDVEAAGTPAAEISVNFDVETFAADVPLALPFRRGDLLLRQGGAHLDGVPLAVSWREDGLALLASIPEAGKYRLELSFSTPLQKGDRQALSVAIPRVPHTTARIGNLSGAAPPETATALGSLRPAGGAGSADWQLELGAVSELSLQAAAGPSPSEQQPVEAEQLLWWKVRPGSVIVDSVTKFRGLMGPLREVQLRFDSRLRLLPMTDLPPGAAYRVEEGATSTLIVSLSDASQELVLRPRFLLSQSSGIGKIIPPRIEPVAARISRQWMGVTATPGLELMPLEQPLVNIVPSDFASEAGMVDALPQAVFDLAGAAAMPELVFRPETRRPFATSQTTVVCSQRFCRLQYQAEFTNLAAHHVQQRLAIPAGWTATDVAVRDGDLPVGSRWFQQADGHVVVRLNQPPGTSQQLEIHAVAIPAAGQPLMFSPPRPLDVEDGGQTLQVLRRFNCDVRVMAEGSGWSDDAQTRVGRVIDGASRLVAGLSASADRELRPLKLVIAPNRPEVSARLVTRYDGEAPAGGEVTLLCDLEISGGKLDVVRLEVPPDWSGDWKTSPPLDCQTITIPGEDRRIAEFVPDLPLSGKVQLLLQPPLPQTAGEAIRMPDVTLVDVLKLQRLVQVPKVVHGETARWRLAGLQAASLPDELRFGPLAEGEYETLAVSAPHFEAVLLPAATAQRRPLVWLAQYEATWHPPGMVKGEATFLLDAAGLSSSLLQFPPGYQPTFALQDGVPAELVRDHKDVWRLRFVGEQLPQRLTVGFLGSSGLASRKFSVEGPTLIGLPAKATIWSLSGPPSLATGGPDLREMEEFVRLRQDLLQLSATSQLLHSAVQRDLTGLSNEALTQWVRPWRRESAAISQRVRTALNAVVGEDEELRAKFRDIEGQLNRLWTTLPASSPPESAMGPSAGRPDEEQARHLGAALEGHQPRIRLLYVDRSENERATRGALAGMTLLAVAALWLLCRFRTVRDWLAASAPFFVVVAGIGLSCLSPLGLAGLVLAVLGLITAWHAPWSRPLSDERSGVLGTLSRSGGAN